MPIHTISFRLGEGTVDRLVVSDVEPPVPSLIRQYRMIWNSGSIQTNHRRGSLVVALFGKREKKWISNFVSAIFVYPNSFLLFFVVIFLKNFEEFLTVSKASKKSDFTMMTA